jgi:hypothetical protein
LLHFRLACRHTVMSPMGHFRRLGDARYTSAVALTADLKAILRNRR